jgi:hypothetical protein
MDYRNDLGWWPFKKSYLDDRLNTYFSNPMFLLLLNGYLVFRFSKHIFIEKECHLNN